MDKIDIKIWENKVFQRDKRVCQVCGSTKRPCAHHIVSCTKKSPLYLDVNNGITLCNKCHSTFHSICGKRYNTKEQLLKFINYEYTKAKKNKKSKSRKRSKLKSYVYFIKADNTGLVKIGKSVNPKNRLKELQTGSANKLNIIKTIDGGVYLEQAIHAYFAHLRKHGEWFKPDTEMRKFLNGDINLYLDNIYDETKDKIKKGNAKYIKKLSEKFLYI